MVFVLVFEVFRGVINAKLSFLCHCFGCTTGVYFKDTQLALPGGHFCKLTIWGPVNIIKGNIFYSILMSCLHHGKVFAFKIRNISIVNQFSFIMNFEMICGPSGTKTGNKGIEKGMKRS